MSRCLAATSRAPAYAQAAGLSLDGYRELLSGAVKLEGQGTYRWDRGEYAAVGKAQAAGVNWANEILRLEQ